MDGGATARAAAGPSRMLDPMEDPRIAALRRALDDRSPHSAPREPGTLEAGVSLVLRAGAELELLLIERVERAGDPWSGHMALPGGMRERADRDLLATALRETREEVGVTLDRELHLLGALDEVHPGSRRLPSLVIAPFVATVGPAVSAVPDRTEVATALWVPLSRLRGEDAVSEVLVELDDGARRFPSFRYRDDQRDYQIWGLTYRILTGFLELADEAAAARGLAGEPVGHG